MINYEQVLVNELANRIIDLDFYGARDAEQTPESIADLITSDPLTVIEFLVDMVEDLQA